MRSMIPSLITMQTLVVDLYFLWIVVDPSTLHCMILSYGNPISLIWFITTSERGAKITFWFPNNTYTRWKLLYAPDNLS